MRINSLIMRKRRSRRGASAVEFALTAPLLFLFIFGLFEFGRMMMVKQSLSNAAQVGSRKACLATTTTASQVDAEVRRVLRESIPNASDPTLLRVNVTPNSLTGIATESAVTVDVQVDLDNVTWAPIGLLSFLGNPTLAAQSVQDRE